MSVRNSAYSDMATLIYSNYAGDDDCENIVIERRPCHNGPCDLFSASQCLYLPWSGWMPCSTTCGKGEIHNWQV